MMTHRILMLGTLFALGCGAADAAPEIALGKPAEYCITHCYLSIPFSVSGYASNRQSGMVFCDIEAEAAGALPVYGGETRARVVTGSSVGVFKNINGAYQGNVELDTGILKPYFKWAKLKSAHCRL